MLNRMRVVWKLVILTVMMLVGFSVVGVNALSTIAVGGPYYRDIIHSKDLVADILPPPEYIVETQLLVATMVMDDGTTGVKPFIERLKLLEQEYNDRHEYWATALTDDDSRDLLLVKSYEPAKEYFRIATTAFVEAIQQDDKALAHDIFTQRLTPLYIAHREAVVHLVNVEVHRAERLQTEVEALVRTQAVEMFMVVGAIACIALVLTIVIARSIVVPLNEATAAASALVAGQDGIVMKYEGTDELGDLANSFRTLAGYVHDVSETNRQVAESLQRVLQRFSQVSGVHEPTASQAGYKAIFSLINSHREKPPS